MTHSLYTKFILGYLLFGLLGFILIATFSSQHHLPVSCGREQADALYDEANLLADRIQRSSTRGRHYRPLPTANSSA